MAERTQLVFIENVLWGGGAEKCIYDLVHALNQDRYEIHLVHLYRQEGEQARFDARISLHCVDAHIENQQTTGYRNALAGYRGLLKPSWRGKLALAARLRHIAIQLKPNLPDGVVGAYSDLRPTVVDLNRVLSQFNPSALYIPVMEEALVQIWLSQALTPRRYIASLHNAESYHMPVLYPEARRRGVEELMLASACRCADCVVFPSEGCRQDFHKGYRFPLSQLEVIANPIDVESIRIQSKLGKQQEGCVEITANIIDESYIHLEETVMHDKTVFVHAARLSAQKNHRLLIDACELYHQRDENFVVLCLGDGSMRGEIQNEVDARGLHDHILLLGHVPNPYPYMARARAVLLTSHFESFAIVLAEAMACGTVPVAVDCPHGPREVLADGRYGLLIEPESPLLLADAMFEIAKNDKLVEQYTLLGEEGARRYSVSTIAARWERLFGIL